MNSASPARRFSWKRLLLILLAGWVLFGIIRTAYDAYITHQLHLQAERYQREAASIASSTLTEEDAAKWLMDQGYELVLKGEGWYNGEHAYVVRGGFFLDEERANWLQICFRFDEQHHFVLVANDIWPGHIWPADYAKALQQVQIK